MSGSHSSGAADGLPSGIFSTCSSALAEGASSPVLRAGDFCCPPGPGLAISGARPGDQGVRVRSDCHRDIAPSVGDWGHCMTSSKWGTALAPLMVVVPLGKSIPHHIAIRKLRVVCCIHARVTARGVLYL